MVRNRPSAHCWCCRGIRLFVDPLAPFLVSFCRLVFETRRVRGFRTFSESPERSHNEKKTTCDFFSLFRLFGVAADVLKRRTLRVLKTIGAMSGVGGANGSTKCLILRKREKRSGGPFWTILADPSACCASVCAPPSVRPSVLGRTWSACRRASRGNASWVGGKRGNDFRVLTVMGGGSRGRVSFDDGVRKRKRTRLRPL